MKIADDSDTEESSSQSAQSTADIHAALVHQLYRQSRTAFAGALAGAIILTIALWGLVSNLILTIWLVAYVIVQIARFALVRWYFKKSPAAGESMIWERLFAVGNFVGGALWGFAGIALFPASSVPHQFMLALFIVGITSGAAAFYWPSPAAYFPTILVELLPLSGRFFAQGDETGLLTGFVLLMFSAVVLLMARYLNSFGTDSLRLRFEKEGLLECLQRARDELEKRVADRTEEVEAYNEKLLVAIAQCKRAEAESSRRERRLKALIANAEDLIFIKDCDLEYTHVNPAMLQLLGLSEAEVIGKTASEIFSPEEARQLTDLDSRALAGQSIQSEHVQYPQGEARVFRVSRTPMRDESGVIIGICGIGRECTDERFVTLRQSGQGPNYSSGSIRTLIPDLIRVAPTDSIVLLLGESGSGKDYWARWIHDHSLRARGPFFSVNCAALPVDIVESELFGHEAGAFTGATRRKRGLLELAEGGTFLLNEVAELPLVTQAKLLTFLDTKEITRVGGEKSVRVDARIVVATNRDLHQAAQSGAFRADLFHRINVFSVDVPPLRHRTEDIPVLCDELLDQIAHKSGRTSVPFVDPKTMEALVGYSWPGNIRELRNALERGLILCDGNRLMPGHLGIGFQKPSTSNPAGDELTVVLRVCATRPMIEQIQAAKKTMIVEALCRTRGNVAAAARLLGTSRDVLRHHIKTLGLEH